MKDEVLLKVLSRILENTNKIDKLDKDIAQLRSDMVDVKMFVDKYKDADLE